MSQLEEDAKPLLISLIDGTHSGTLGTEQTRLLSFWVFKTALTLHSIAIQGLFIPRIHYTAVCERGAIPNHVVIAVAQIRGQADFFWIQNQNWPGVTGDMSADDFSMTYKIAVQLGQFAARVHYWPFEDRYMHEYFADNIAHIWVDGPQAISWPPKNIMTNLQEFEESLVIGRKIDGWHTQR